MGQSDNLNRLNNNQPSTMQQQCQYYMTIKFGKLYILTAENFGMLMSAPSQSKLDDLSIKVNTLKNYSDHFCAKCFSTSNLKYCKFGCVSCEICMNKNAKYCSDC